MDFVRPVLARGGGSGVAPGGAGFVVGADGGDFGDGGLDESPVEGMAAGDEDGRASGAGAVQMDAVAADIDEFTQRRRGGLSREQGAQDGE